MKRERRLLWIGLTILGAVLAASVGIVLYLESRPDLQRFSDPDDLQTAENADWKSDFYQALELFNLGNFTGAEAELLKIIQRRPGTPDAWQLLGAVYYRLDRMDAAERSFRHLIRQQPFNAAGYNNLSQTLIRLNRMPEALDAALRAAELAPGNGAILLNVAGLYAKERNDKEALYYLRRTLAAGVTAEVIARDAELVRLLERPEFMKLFEEQRQKAPEESVPSSVAPAAVVPYRENTSSVRLLTDEFNLPESSGENRKESAPLPVKIESAPSDGGTR